MAKARDRELIARSKTSDHAKRLEKCWRYAANALAKAYDDFAAHVQKYGDHLVGLGVSAAELDPEADIEKAQKHSERAQESDVFDEEDTDEQGGAGGGASTMVSAVGSHSSWARSINPVLTPLVLRSDPAVVSPLRISCGRALPSSSRIGRKQSWNAGGSDCRWRDVEPPRPSKTTRRRDGRA